MKYTQPELPRSAIVTIDTQCDFSLPGAAAHIPGTMAVIPNMARLLAVYRQCGRPVVHIVRLYMPDGSNVDLCRREMVEGGTRVVAPGTEGAELVPDLKPALDARLDADLLLKGRFQKWGQKEFVVYKSRWGAFYNTRLHDLFQKLDVNTLIICGCNFPNCPRTTIYEASERDYKIVLVEDAVSGIYEQGMNEMRNIGVHPMPTDLVIEKIGNESGAAPDSDKALLNRRE